MYIYIYIYICVHNGYIYIYIYDRCWSHVLVTNDCVSGYLFVTHYTASVVPHVSSAYRSYANMRSYIYIYIYIYTHINMKLCKCAKLYICIYIYIYMYVYIYIYIYIYIYHINYCIWYQTSSERGWLVSRWVIDGSRAGTPGKMHDMHYYHY